MKKAALLFVAGTLFFAAPARADDKPSGPPRPAKEMAQLSYLAGTWTCAGKSFPSPFGPEHASAGTAAVKLTLGGFWYEVHYDEKKTPENSTPFHLVQLLGYDAGQELFVSHCFDAMGGSCSQTSAGWKEDVLAFEGASSAMGQKSGARDTFTKISATEMKHAGFMQGPDGKWMPTDEETCTKPAAKEPAKKK